MPRMKIAARKPAISVTMPPPNADHQAGPVAAQTHHLFGQPFERRQAFLLLAAGQKQYLVRNAVKGAGEALPPGCEMFRRTAVACAGRTGRLLRTRTPRSTTGGVPAGFDAEKGTEICTTGGWGLGARLWRRVLEGELARAWAR